MKLKKKHSLQEKFFLNLKNSDEDFKALNEKIILLGFVLDGELSNREKKRFNILKKENITNKTIPQLKLLLTNFLNGKGLN